MVVFARIVLMRDCSSGSKTEAGLHPFSVMGDLGAIFSRVNSPKLGSHFASGLLAPASGRNAVKATKLPGRAFAGQGLPRDQLSLPDRQHVFQRRVRTRNDVDGNQFAQAPCRRGSRLGDGIASGDVSA